MVEINKEKPLTYTIQITNVTGDTYFGGSSTFDKNTNKRSNTKNVGLYSTIHTNATARSIPSLYLMKPKIEARAGAMTPRSGHLHVHVHYYPSL